MLSITLLLLDYNPLINYIGNLLMLVAVVLTVVSMLYYLDQAKKYFNQTI